MSEAVNIKTKNNTSKCEKFKKTNYQVNKVRTQILKIDEKLALMYPHICTSSTCPAKGWTKKGGKCLHMCTSVLLKL